MTLDRINKMNKIGKSRRQEAVSRRQVSFILKSCNPEILSKWFDE